MAPWLKTESSDEKEARGFPLLEMMIVLACIGILVTIAIQKFLVY
jgi:prepilin-type N-terminal cleavage/methylation domain-containing protein